MRGCRWRRERTVPRERRQRLAGARTPRRPAIFPSRGFRLRKPPLRSARTACAPPRSSGRVLPPCSAPTALRPGGDPLEAAHVEPEHPHPGARARRVRERPGRRRGEGHALAGQAAQEPLVSDVHVSPSRGGRRGARGDGPHGSPDPEWRMRRGDIASRESKTPQSQRLNEAAARLGHHGRDGRHDQPAVFRSVARRGAGGGERGAGGWPDPPHWTAARASAAARPRSATARPAALRDRAGARRTGARECAACAGSRR